MEIYDNLFVAVESPEQAALFMKLFKEIWIGFKIRRWDDTTRTIEERHFKSEFLDSKKDIAGFLKKGGELGLYGFMFALCEDPDYKALCTELAQTYPQQAFTLRTWNENCSSEGEDAGLYEYREGVLRMMLTSADSYSKCACSACADRCWDEDIVYDTLDPEDENTGLGEDYNLIDWLLDGKKSVCPRCGAPVFTEDEYDLRYDSEVIAPELMIEVLGPDVSLQLPDGTQTVTDVLVQPVRGVLTEAIIPEGVTAIDARAFKNCRALRKVVLPESLQKIGREAFAGCVRLTDITVPAHGLEFDTAVPAYGRIFDGCTALADAEGRIVLGGTVYAGVREEEKPETVRKEEAFLDAFEAIATYDEELDKQGLYPDAPHGFASFMANYPRVKRAAEAGDEKARQIFEAWTKAGGAPKF